MNDELQAIFSETDEYVQRVIELPFEQRDLEAVKRFIAEQEARLLAELHRDE